jgi:hypothetical protein
MPTPTEELITRTTLTAAAASVTISSIPNNYTDLILVAVPIVTSATTFAIRFNSDSGSNYSVTGLYGDGTSAASWRLSAQTEIRVTYAATSRTTNTGNFIVNANNYSNSTTHKTNLSRGNIASDGTDAIVGLWRSTATINSITIIPISGGTIINTGSTFSLYGVL